MRSVVLATIGFGGCVMPPAQPSQASATPSPTVADPLNGLPALSGDGKTLALATFTTNDRTQQRAITFIGVGELEGASGTTLEVPAATSETVVGQIAERYRDGHYASLPWVMTPDNPPLPMAITVAGTELYFAGDPKTQLSLAVNFDSRPVATDTYQVQGESETSPEHVIAVGATVLWRAESGFAYVRYDIDDGAGRDSDWRVVALEKPKAEPAK